MQIVTLSKKMLKQQLKESEVAYAFYKTPAGTLSVASTKFGIIKAEFVQDKEHHIDFPLTKLNDSCLILAGTDFQIKVWKAALSIPSGKTVSYKQLASAIGHPKAHRAVGNALKNNPIAYFVPCHRILLSNGDVCGYKWGVERKRKLLQTEKGISSRISIP